MRAQPILSLFVMALSFWSASACSNTKSSTIQDLNFETDSVDTDPADVEIDVSARDSGNRMEDTVLPDIGQDGIADNGIGDELECGPLPLAKVRTLSAAATDGALEPGEVLSAELDAPVVLPVMDGDEEFLLILYDLGTAMDTVANYEVTIERGSSRLVVPPATHDVSLDSSWLKHQPPVHAQQSDTADKPFPEPPPPEIGQLLEFQVPSGYLVLEIQAEVMLVTDALVICNDVTTENPLDDVDPAVMTSLAQYFEDLIRPRERFFWGQESDINSDGRVTMLFSHLVNDSDAYAFVTHCDLLDNTVCGFTNSQEVIYVAIPDPDEKIHTPEAFAELIAHEFNHSIYFARKFLNNGFTDSPENVYVTEGMSGLAQDLTGFARGNQFVAMAGLQGTDEISLPDMHQYDPEEYYFSDRDGALRGASYLFLRYLFDQAGGEMMDMDGILSPTCGSQLLAHWINSPLTGPDLIEDMTGVDYNTVAVNWFTAVGISNRRTSDTGEKLPVHPVFSYLPQAIDPITGNERGIDLWGAALGMVPLTGPKTDDVSLADGVLRAGGVDYLTVKADGSGDITLHFTLGEATNPGLRVVRIDAANQ
jgi:hypothetical protein